MSSKISDELAAETEHLLNAAIHELVFAIQHANNDEPDDACTCLVQAQINIETINEKLAKL
jgi:hypothetical protein